MIIIGHRGAAGIAPENTIPSIEAAVREGVDMIEFDIRTTKDNKIIVAHDPNLIRIAGSTRMISDMTLKELRDVSTKSGHPIPTLEEALGAAKNVPVFLDCKGKDWAEPLHKELTKYTDEVPCITSTNSLEMHRFHVLHGDVETYLCEYLKPFEAIYQARLFKFTGINLSVWVINPLVYYYIRHKKMKLTIFTVNYPFLARFVHFLYPQAAIITNVPHRLASLASSRKKKQ